MKTPLLVAALLVVGMGGSAVAAPAFVNGWALDGGLLDRSGGTSVNNGRVGYFSDLYYDPNRQQWWGLSDRGPGGGSLDYDTRVQRFHLDVNSATGAISGFRIDDTLLFRDANGLPYNGKAPFPSSILGRALDPEGFVILPKTGNFLVSDEYGPSLLEFDRTGAFVRAFETPQGLIPRNASNTPNYASDTGNTAGKRSNRGFEGLAVSPDGLSAFAMLQSPMLDEGGATDGRFARIVKFDIPTGKPVAQYAYLLDRAGQGQGISALVALNNTQFLVLERNNRGLGIGATLSSPDKRVYQIDLTGASDIAGVTLPVSGTTLPAGVVAVSKGATFLNLAANTLSQIGNKVPEKWEGLTIGPKLDDGSYLLLAGTDNDYSVTQNSSGNQFDVYLRFSDADPYAARIECPLGVTTGCTGAASSVPTNGSYTLLPGVMQAYKTPASDFSGYEAPVPGPLPLLGAASALGWCRRLRRRIQGV